MVASNSPYHASSTPSTPLAESLRVYLDHHPEVSPREFLMDALQREMDARARQESGEARHPSPMQRPLRPTAEDVRIHTWLTERLAAVRREKEGLWARTWRLFGGRG